MFHEPGYKFLEKFGSWISPVVYDDGSKGDDL
jgi:hypothetical protein